MKNSGKKNLLRYSAFSAPFIITPMASNAQIVYQNIDPDEVIQAVGWPTGYYYGTVKDETYLDVDGDGISDLHLIHEHFKSHSDMIFYYANMEAIIPSGGFACAGSADPWIADKLNPGDNINSGLNWYTGPYDQVALGNRAYTISTSYLMGWSLGPQEDGNFIGKTGFVAIEKIDDPDTYYGWLRLTVGDSTGFIKIHDLAFNNTPNDPILAGETDFPCDPSIIISATMIADNKAFIKWQPVPGATQYQLQVRKTGAVSWNTFFVNAPKTSRKVPIPVCDANYECRIAAINAAGSSPFSSTYSFYAPVCRLEVSSLETNPVIYPNPANDQITIDLDGISGNSIIEIFDIAGKLIQTIHAENNEYLNIDISNYANGIYFVRIENADMNKSLEFVKE